MYNKPVSTYPPAIQLVSNQYKTQEMCDKAVGTCPFLFNSIPDQYKTEEMCDKVVSKDPFMLKYCLYKDKTQAMCGKAVKSYLLGLNLVLDWFVNDQIVFGDLDSDFVTFFSNDKFLNSLTLDNINLDEKN